MAKRNIGDCIRYSMLMGIIKETYPSYIIYWFNRKNTGIQTTGFVENECQLINGKIWNILYG
jgi:hypothetical protein